MMTEHDKDLRILSLQLAAQSWRPEMECSLVQLADDLMAFISGSQNWPTPPTPPKWAHDIASALVVLAQKVSIMTIATDANTAAQARLATAVDAALVVIANGGGTATADQIADAAALPASTEALNTQASRLEAVLPPPVQPAQ